MPLSFPATVTVGMYLHDATLPALRFGGQKGDSFKPATFFSQAVHLCGGIHHLSYQLC